MEIRNRTRRQIWKGRQPYGANTLLSGLGAIVLILLLAAGICASLLRRLSV